ncbi:MAG TPA: 30S ribosomal protein S21 [Candidatus Brocadiia bacterium]|nr:30S ribosomal protein S21 [Candidatus Brocadiia bacterium]
MAKVLIKQDEQIKEAIRRFKKLVDKEGIINTAKRGAYFEKPSEKRRREQSQRLKSIRKGQRENEF